MQALVYETSLDLEGNSIYFGRLKTKFVFHKFLGEKLPVKMKYV